MPNATTSRAGNTGNIGVAQSPRVAAGIVYPEANRW
jgi:hypothetical protein